MPVREYVRGDAFGDLGLVCDCKHSITVRCREPGTLWLLQRSNFHAALLSTSERRADSACKTLRRVAALSFLSDAQLALLAGATQQVTLPPSAPLLRRGEAWDALYIVCAGSLEDRCFQANKKVKVKGLGEGRGRIIRAGEYLGEEALAHLRASRKPTVGFAMADMAAAASTPADAGNLGASADMTPSRSDAVKLATPVAPAPAVSAGESGCSLLRLSAAAVSEALSDDSQSQGFSQPVFASEIDSRGILTRLAEAEPCLTQAFTSAGQRAQLLSVLEVLRPPPGTELQRRGEPSEGILLLEAGTLLKGTPWGASSRRPAQMNAAAQVGIGGVCGAGLLGVRRGSGASLDSSIESLAGARRIQDDAPVEPGECVGSLGADPSPTSLYAHVGVVAVRLPRKAALVILASTHEFCKGKLTPRATPYHLRRPLPPPPPFGLLTVASLLGEGGSSRVLLVRKKASTGEVGSPLCASPSRKATRCQAGREEYALKVLQQAYIAGTPQREIRRDAGKPGDNGALQASRERLALAACNHQFVPRLEGACDGFLMMEAVRGCELFYLLREVHRFEPDTAAFYGAMVLSALLHMHSLDLVHRDVKPENLVLDAEGYLRLVDLGLCRVLSHPAERTYTLCGTPEYTAPEVLRGAGHGKEVDIWAMGVLLFELMAGYPAFCADEPIKVYSLVLRCQPAVPLSFGRRARELLSCLLRPQPHARLGAMRGGLVNVATTSFFERIDWIALLGRQAEAPLIPVVAETTEPAPAERSRLQALLAEAASGSANGEQSQGVA